MPRRASGRSELIESLDVESASLRQESSQSADPSETPRTTSSSAEPSLADVESASMADTEAQASSVDPLEDTETATATADVVKAGRWQCELCFEPHQHFETSWRLITQGTGDDRSCNHIFCRRCLLGSIRWGGRCPYDNTPIPAIVVCGAMGTGEYVYHEKLKEARRIRGVPCSVSDCPGVVSGSDNRQPHPSSCSRCETRHCGRRVCGVPWSQTHRCWDLQDEELDARILSGRYVHARTTRRLATAPRIRPCPQCAVIWSTLVDATWFTTKLAAQDGASFADGLVHAKISTARLLAQLLRLQEVRCPMQCPV